MTDDMNTGLEREESQVGSTPPWRDTLKIHPACGLLPPMEPDELKKTGGDIEKNGLRHPIVLLCKGQCPSHRGRLDPRRVKWEDVELLDGRNRLDAIESVGLKVEFRDHGIGIFLDVNKTLVADEDEIDPDGIVYLKKGEEYEERLFSSEPTILFESDDRGEKLDTYAYVISANILRRHLTTAQKGDLIEALLKEAPERSDRAIAKLAQVSDKTIAARREKLEGRSEIPHVKNRTDTKGRQQPSEKPKPAQAPTEPAPIAPPPQPIALPVTEGQGDAAQVVETDDPPQPVAPADHSEPAREDARDPAEQVGQRDAELAEQVTPVSPVLPEPIGVKVTAAMMKWMETFESWNWPYQELALCLIKVDKDSLADLGELRDLLELERILIDAQREKISRLEQENRSLQERLASQLEPAAIEPDQPQPGAPVDPEVAKLEYAKESVKLLSPDDPATFAVWVEEFYTKPAEPEPATGEPEVVEEPVHAEPVLADVVEATERVAAEVIEPEQRGPHPLIDKFFDYFASNPLWGQQRLEETQEEHAQIKFRDTRTQWLQDFDELDPETRIAVRGAILSRSGSARPTA